MANGSRTSHAPAGTRTFKLYSADRRPMPSFHVCLEPGTGSVGLLTEVGPRLDDKGEDTQSGSNTGVRT